MDRLRVATHRRDLLERVELDGEAYHGIGEVLPEP